MQTTATFACDGRSASFSCPFPAAAKTDVRCYLVAKTGAPRALVLNQDYTVELLESSVHVSTSTVWSGGLALRVERRTQLTDLGDVRQLGYLVQELLSDQQLRVIAAGEGEQLGPLPDRSRRAQRLLGFDAQGDPIALGIDKDSAAWLQLMLADTVYDNTGAGMVSFDERRDYPPGTLGHAVLALMRRVDFLGG